MPNFEAVPQNQEAPEPEKKKSFLEEEADRLEAEETDFEGEREIELVKAVESIVNDEVVGYAKSVMDALRSLPGETVPSSDQLVLGLAKDAVERLKASDASFGEITPESLAIQALARRGLKQALETEMASLGADDLESLSRIERVIDSL